MSTAETLTLYTVPSSWTRSKVPGPYDRVVGVLDHKGFAIWTPKTGYNDNTSVYSQGDATETVLAVNGLFKARLTEFFTTFLVQPYSTDYNCHRFGRWMSGEVFAKDSRGQADPHNILTDGRLTNGLSLGQHGAIGRHQGGRPYVPHSIVGLGKDSPDCIEVTSFGGYMAVSPYEDVRAIYDIPEVATEGRYGLYAL